MFISPAYAQSAAGDGGGGLVQLLPLVLIFVVFYFLLIRPQQKKMKAHKALVAGLRKGDKVVTGGGLIGTVTKEIDETEVQIELAENVRVRVMRHMVQEVLSRTEAAEKSGSGKDKEEALTPKQVARAANDDAGNKPKSLLGGLFGGKSDK